MIEAIKKHPLHEYSPEDILIVCKDSNASHCCGAIIKYFYTKCGKDASAIKVLHKPSGITVQDIGNYSLIFFADTTVEDVVVEQAHKSSKKIVLFDYARKAPYNNVIHITNEKHRLCTGVWEYFFWDTPLHRVPSCVTYIDDYVTSVEKERGACFYYGMYVMETSPEHSQEFWESLFDCRENLSSDASEEDIMDRLKWDSMLQVTNMGSIIKTFMNIFTEKQCAGALHRGNAVLVNVREPVRSVLQEFFTDCTCDYVLTYYVCGTSGEDVVFEYTCYAITDSANALAYTSKYGSSGNSRRASFTSTIIPNHIGD